MFFVENNLKREMEKIIFIKVPRVSATLMNINAIIYAHTYIHMFEYAKNFIITN